MFLIKLTIVKGQKECKSIRERRDLTLTRKSVNFATYNAGRGDGDYSTYGKARLSISIYSLGTWSVPTGCSFLMMSDCTCLN